MDKIPRIPSHSETHASVRCKAAEHKLSCLKDELDKVWHTESRSLGIHRNRFVLDRRRSLGNVYVTQMEGTQSNKRSRRPRRESAPEVIDIFRRQEDRRQSVKAIEKALSEDVMRRLERKYQEAIIRTGSDVEDQDDGNGREAEDDDDWGTDAGVLLAPNIDIEGPDYRVTRGDDGEVQGTGREGAISYASSSHQPSTSPTAKRHAPANQKTPKETGGHKTQTLNPNQGQGDDNTSSDSAARDVNTRPSDVTKETPSSPAQTRQVPRKKRSYSDGNIFLDIMAFENRALYPYTLTKAGVGGGDEENSEDEMQMLSRQRTFTVGEETSDSHSSSGTSENELSGEDSDVHGSPHRSRRRVGTVSFDVKLVQRHQNYVTSHSPEPDVTQSPTLPRRQNDSARHTEEIRLSPSLKRRLAHSDLASPRYAEKNLANTFYSPSVTRRQAEVNYVSPQQPTCRSLTDDDSPTRRATKRDKPKRIYQPGDAGRQMRKSRPLRRSRSENVDISALVRGPEAQDFSGRGARTARRGSDSLQTLSLPFSRNAPRGWNSLMFGLALSQEEREDIARHKRKELVTSLRKRQQEVDSDVSRRIRTFLQRYDDA